MEMSCVSNANSAEQAGIKIPQLFVAAVNCAYN
jgi:hypothetical protein